MFTFLIVLILVVALLMALVVLLQSGKGGGLAGIASGGQATQILGARQAPDFLERATWSLGAAFLALCVITTFFVPRATVEGGSILQERADELPAATPAPLPSPEPATELPSANPATPTAPDVPPTE